MESYEELRRSEVNIMLLGSTGSGKSSTGNTIIRTKKFEERCSPAPVTTICKSENVKLDEQLYNVIDTVGLSSTSKKIHTEIQQMLQGEGVDVFLLVIKLGLTFTESDWKTVEWIKENFGDKILKHTILLFTHKDQLQGSIEKYIEKCEKLQLVLKDCSRRYYNFNNKEENQTQVMELLEEVNELRKKNECRYTESDYKEAQDKIVKKKYCRQAAKGGLAGGVLGAAGGAVAVKTGTVALSVVAGLTAGAAAGAVLAAAGTCAGAYLLATKCFPR